MKRFLLSLLLLLLSTGSIFAQLTKEPDIFITSKGELVVYPINHGTVAFTYNDLTIFVDPFGGAELFSDFDAPNLILITDLHGDHHNAETLSGLDTENAIFLVPQAVYDIMDQTYRQNAMVIGNGESKEVSGLKVLAIPMYNLPDDESSRHKKGRGNGYIISFGDTDVYLSGDTEDIPEMRELKDIDIAFVCMNLPYTMDIYQAASAVVAFKPKVMYPYHHRGQDIKIFKKLIDLAEIDTEIRLKNWY